MRTKYKQPNKAVCVRFDAKTIGALQEFASERRWSVASAVAYCVEQQLGIPPARTIGRRR